MRFRNRRLSSDNMKNWSNFFRSNFCCVFRSENEIPQHGIAILGVSSTTDNNSETLQTTIRSNRLLFFNLFEAQQLMNVRVEYEDFDKNVVACFDFFALSIDSTPDSTLFLQHHHQPSEKLGTEIEDSSARAARTVEREKETLR